jgi:hypothetical protein
MPGASSSEIPGSLQHSEHAPHSLGEVRLSSIIGLRVFLEFLVAGIGLLDR